jgi:hypothetical protein
MFIGDSANLSFLQVIRRLFGECMGPCAFVDDPLRYLMVEASPEGQPNWLNASSQRDPPRLSLSHAQALVKRYIFATNCVLDLFDESVLLEHLPAWAEGRWQDSMIPSSIFHLVLAIGAQTAPEENDELAEVLFTYGRYLTAQNFMEDASMLTVQSYALITMYLLGACRRNAAFMYLGIAVRAAYAIGLHRKDVASSFSLEEFKARERLWKVMRILDLFMSASMGRPPSTAETRDTEADEDYSASNDLCAIFEKILTDVYSRRMISTAALSSIGSHHRRWTSRFFRGLAEDKIDPSEVLEGGSMPNIGLLHIKEAYYWTIILITRPFLTESIMLHAQRARERSNEAPEPCTATGTNKVLVTACVDSAIRTVDLLKVLLDCRSLPKRLPFVINSLFIAALVLGFSYLGDLYQVFPLGQSLKLAQKLLAQFSNDAIAQRNASIVGYLCEACETYLELRTAQNMECQSFAVGSMFGQIHRLRTQATTRAQTPSRDHGDTMEGSLRAPDGIHEPNVAAVDARKDRSMQPLPDYSAGFDLPDDFANTPQPTMTPRTLWFNSFDENMPLFSTISNANDFAGALPNFWQGQEP